MSKRTSSAAIPNTETLVWNGCKVVIRRKRLRDQRLIDYVLNNLPERKGVERLYQWGWADAIAHTQSIEGFDYQMPTIISTPEEVVNSFEKFLDLDADFTEKWAEKCKLLDVSTAVPKAELPTSELTKEEQEDPK